VFLRTELGIISKIILLISGFHRALLQSITFISQLMHSIIQNLVIFNFVSFKLLYNVDFKL